MSTIVVKGLDGIAMNYASRKTEMRENFNKRLFSLVEEWQKTAANTFVNKSGVQGFKEITEVAPLSRQSGGTRGTIRAKISFEVKSISLTDFTVEQQRRSKDMALNEASVKRGKYKEKKIGAFSSYGQTFTKAKILKQTSTKLVVVRKKSGKLASAEGLKGFMYSPTNRVSAKPDTPLGVYVRLQKETWKKGKRLPTYKIYAPPLALVMVSKRVLTRARVYQKIGKLLDV